MHVKETGSSRTNNLRRTKLYMTWCRIRQKCYAATSRHYQWYGARGIAMCDEWRNDYEAFRSWAIRSGVKRHLTIDRIDNDGPYSPDNCRWITQSQQNRNKRPSGKPTNAKIGPEIVRRIRASRLPNSALAQVYGLTHSHVIKIRKGDVWKNVN